ncbi:AAA-ATPase-like protein [Tanacetum coccineum]
MPSPVTKSKIPTIKTIISTIGTVATTVMVVRSVAKDYLPPEFRDYIYFGFKNFINKFSTHLTIVIYESDDFKPNEIFKATELYLSDKISPVTNRLKDGMSRSLPCELQSLELTFHREHKDMALNEYLPFILKHAEMKNKNEKIVKLFTLNPTKAYFRQAWLPVHLDHPSTFSTLAMDREKDMVTKDLDRFLERREFYREVGKVWKRGPPGTGKSSLIAAMANYLKFDIYDLELSSIRCNSDLRSILLATENRSILVVEDIDCSVELHDRVSKNTMKVRDNPLRYYDEQSRVTLSGFLNFIDGLWSSCGDERIIIFTTNRKDKLDPALLRPGRMDVHINMSYCTPCGFRLLASNYLGITQHNLFDQIEDLIGRVEITPAEVAEQLLKDDNPDVALAGLIELFEMKRKEKEIIRQAQRAKKREGLVAKESEEKKQVDNKETELLAEENEVKE